MNDFIISHESYKFEILRDSAKKEPKNPSFGEGK